MPAFLYDRREKRAQRRRARAAFRQYAMNGWESPWIRKNSLFRSIFYR